MKQHRIGLILLCLLALLGLAAQQDMKLNLGLVRNFGYGGLGKIQGSFSLKINDPPPGLYAVEFYLDEQLVERVEGDPFRAGFQTSSYPEGEHTFSALGYLEDGSVLYSNQITKTILSSDQAWAETRRVVGPILIGTAALTLLGLGSSLLFVRQQKFTLGQYGPAGGAICSRCRLPFNRSVFALNLALGKLVRCPHCGKISVRPRASRVDLEEAESRFRQGAQPALDRSPEEEFLRGLEESRFEE